MEEQPTVAGEACLSLRAAIVLLALVFVASVRVSACPACNIHNYLAESVLQSTNIVVGRLSARADGERVTVEVIRTLRGSYRPRRVIEMQAWTQPADTGKVFIFSDPWDYPSYPVLEMDFEDEVQFLLRLGELERASLSGRARSDAGNAAHISPKTLRRYRVSGVDEAIRRVQGWSNESKDVGMEYLFRCKPFPTRQIIDTIGLVRDGLFAGKEAGSAPNRLGNLVEALMLVESAEAEGYMLEQTKPCLQQNEQSVDWTKIPRAVGPRGEWLTELLGLAGGEWTHWSYAATNSHRKVHPQLVEKQKRTVLAALPQLRGLVLSEAAYALYETEGTTLEQLLPLLESSPSKDEFVLGIYWSASRKAGPWYGGKSDGPLADLELLGTQATRPELKKQMAEGIEFARKWRAPTETK
jgi:hypothetical protein